MSQRIAIDIGSTIVKVATIDDADGIHAQRFVERDYESTVAEQVLELLAGIGPDTVTDLRICSSANGGLRVGIVCLTRQYSGAVYRNQVLLAGANPVFVHAFDELEPHPEHVDVLLVGGGVDCDDASPLAQRLAHFDPGAYRFTTLIYAGSRCLGDEFARRFGAKLIQNPLSDSLRGTTNSVFLTLRDAYLDDLVYKAGVSELTHQLDVKIHPTPEIVNRGFQRAVSRHSSLSIVGSCILLDIGGATTDIHYTVEIIRDDSDARPGAGSSVSRYVFTDLGVFASRDSAILQLRNHPRLYEFLTELADDRSEIDEQYRSLRDGGREPNKTLLAYACVFIALDRFTEGRGPGLPVADLGRVSQLILTGGAAQAIDEARVASLVKMLMPATAIAPAVLIDRSYRVWVDGITWDGALTPEVLTKDTAESGAVRKVPNMPHAHGDGCSGISAAPRQAFAQRRDE